VFIVYKLVDKVGKTTLASIYACKQVAQKLLATEELAHDLMFPHYPQGERSVTVDVR
jgi:hypothetical protein